MTDTVSQPESARNKPRCDDLSAVFINCTLTPSPTFSHTGCLMKVVCDIMTDAGAAVTEYRAVDHAIAPGVQPDMTEHGAARDDWPSIAEAVLAADMLLLGTPIWLGEVSSELRKVVERLYAHSSQTNDKGQYIFYGKVGGVVVTGNEDGVKHCAMSTLYSLAHIGYSIPPQPDAGWLGPIGPGPSYGDKKDGEEGRVGFDHLFTQRNATFLAWNMLHMARMLKDAGGLPGYGNDADAWDAGERYNHPRLS